MKKLLFFLMAYCIVVYSQSAQAANDTATKPPSLREFVSGLKKINTPPKKMELMIKKMLLDIETECCAESFELKSRLLEIEQSLKRCLENNCHKKTAIVFTKKNRKLVVYNEIEEGKNLIFENLKAGYADKIENEKKKMRLALENFKKKEKEFNKFKTEHDAEIKKFGKKHSTQISENQDLVSLVDLYNQKINVLEKRNDELTDLYEKAVLQNKTLNSNLINLKKNYEDQNDELNSKIMRVKSDLEELNMIIDEMYKDVNFTKREKWKKKLNK